MKTRRKRWFARVLTGLAAIGLAVTLFAGNPFDIPVREMVWYDGEQFHMDVTRPDVFPPGAFNPLYSVVDQVPPTKALQNSVLSKIPGDPGYSARWEQFAVLLLDSRDVSTNPFKSDEEILDAQAAGKVLVIDAEFSFICPVLKGKP